MATGWEVEYNAMLTVWLHDLNSCWVIVLSNMFEGHRLGITLRDATPLVPELSDLLQPSSSMYKDGIEFRVAHASYLIKMGLPTFYGPSSTLKRSGRNARTRDPRKAPASIEVAVLGIRSNLYTSHPHRSGNIFRLHAQNIPRRVILATMCRPFHRFDLI